MVVGAPKATRTVSTRSSPPAPDTAAPSPGAPKTSSSSPRASSPAKRGSATSPAAARSPRAPKASGSSSRAASPTPREPAPPPLPLGPLELPRPRALPLAHLLQRRARRPHPSPFLRPLPGTLTQQFATKQLLRAPRDGLGRCLLRPPLTTPRPLRPHQAPRLASTPSPCVGHQLLLPGLGHPRPCVIHQLLLRGLGLPRPCVTHQLLLRGLGLPRPCVIHQFPLPGLPITWGTTT